MGRKHADCPKVSDWWIRIVSRRRNDAVYTIAGYLIILLGLVIAGLAIGGVAYFVIRTGARPSPDSIVKWTGLVVFTLATFGYAIKQSRRYWRIKAFWIGITALLLVHLTCFLVLFSFVFHWRMFPFFVICVLEGPLIQSLATRLATRRREQA